MSRLFTASISLILLVSMGIVAAGCGGTSEKELKKSEVRAQEQEKMLNPEAAAEEEAAKKDEEKADEKKAEEKKPEDKKAEEEPEEEVAGDAENGKALFVTSCGACHKLSDAGTSGAVGPDLDGLGWDYEKVLNQIKNGGGAMPPNTATGSDAEDIAAYVAEAAK